MSNLPAGVNGNDLEMFGSSQEAAEEFLGIQNEGEFPIISSNFLVLAGALVQWSLEETHVPKVVSSNPGTLYWMDIFSHLFVVNCKVCLKRRK